MSKAIATETKGTALTTEMEELLLAHAGEGTEFSAKDLATPYLSIVQGLSPQRQKDSPKYIEGAEEGMLFNSATNDLFSGEVGLTGIPCHYKLVYNEWKSRDSGGGFVAQHATEQAGMRNKQPDTYLMDTAVYEFVVHNPIRGRWERVVVSLKSTGMKVSRAFNQELGGLRVEVRGNPVVPPMYATKWQITTVTERNRKSQLYHNYKLTYVGLVSSPEEIAAARDLRQMIIDGKLEQTPEGTADARPAF